MRKAILVCLILLSCTDPSPNLFNTAYLQSIPTVSSAEDVYRLELRGGWISYYATQPLELTSPCVKRAVIVVHGANRNADDYFKYMSTATALAKRTLDTYVIAPHFKTEEDPLGEGEAYWTSQGWRKGNLDQTGKNLSAYDFINKIMDELETQFPNLTDLVLTGHSAGGQLTQRFAAIGSKPREIKVRYIPSNLSSYLYLDELRPTPNGMRYPWVRGEDGDLHLSKDFNVTDSSCERTYNDYKYGLEQRNTVGLKYRTTLIKVKYLVSDITYFLGDADTEINSWVDTSCEAMLQGPNRYERGLSYYDYMKEQYPQAEHRLVVVPNVAHSAKEMYQSKQGINLLFYN